MRELSLHLLDLMENALAAGASRLDVEIDEDLANDRLTLRVSDNGRGMTPEMVSRVGDPFFTTRTTRQVGLGIPLLQAAAERCAGGLTITSRPGVGTEVVATFQHSHIDRAPLGDLKSTLLSVLLADRTAELHYRHRRDDRVFAFDTGEMRQMLGEVPLSHPLVRDWLDAFLTEGIAELSGPPGEVTASD